MNYRTISLLMLFVLLAVGLVACKFEPMTFDDEEEPLDFEDKWWVLESYGEPGDTQPVIEGSEITANFNCTTDGVNGSAGCNSYGGKYEVDNCELSITELNYTEMACMEPEGVMGQEQEYLQLLILTESYKIEDGKLHITCSDGSVLVFESK